MSRETAQWLNTRTLIGFTAKRGNAWHYRASEQGAEPNHYTGAIPTEDVRRRLFAWTHAEGDVSATYFDENGVTTITDPDRKSILRPAGTFGPDDKGEILGLFKSGYKVHPFGEWLIDNVGTILDSGLSVGSAGLLKGGAIAWVQCEVPETVTTPEGVAFRPFLTAATSVDGSLSSTYQTGAQLVVCDNTLSAALGAEAKDNRVKVRHSRNSLGKVQEIRDAIGIVYDTADDFSAQVKTLCETSVSPAQWQAFLKEISPEPAGVTPSRGRTLAINKREELSQLWTNDVRVSPWKGTAFGVVQAVNTHAHHVQTVKGATRTERNMLRSVKGEWQALDASTVSTLSRVLSTV
jgi:phage/plasmid-like protein (TIGR03299 family)